jgi:multimeric flavodoxin WrbA
VNLDQIYTQVILEKINSSPAPVQRAIHQFKEYLETKNNILFLTTSNRWEGHKDDKPKSTLLAHHLRSELNEKNIKLIEVPQLTIHCCEGNVSSRFGNHCGTKDAVLKDKDKNPSGQHRCWASINNKNDELWKISKPLLESDCVVFFASIRWGQANSIYQKLIERLTWLENRHTTLGEKNILDKIDAGFVGIGHNWNDQTVVDTQKEVFKFFGFNVPDALSFCWQYTTNSHDETKDHYKEDPKVFEKVFDFKLFPKDK